MYNIEQNYIFTHPQKCAGSSVAIALGLWKLNKETELFKIHRSLLHKPLNDIADQAKQSGMDIEKAFKFSVVRNPWDRMVSRFFFDIKYVDFYKKKNISTFEEYVKFHHRSFIKNGCRKPLEIKPYLFYNGDYCVDFVIRQEKYNEGLKYVCSKIGLENYEIVNHDHKTGRNDKDYKKMYNDETRSMVEEIGSESIAMFSYVF